VGCPYLIKILWHFCADIVIVIVCMFLKIEQKGLTDWKIISKNNCRTVKYL
jgi:hypothetical protein